MQIEYNTLLRQVLTQVTLELHDAVALLWAAVRAVRAVSMTKVVEGKLCWDDSTQWALNRVAVLNSQNLNTAPRKTRVCKVFNDGSCNSDSHHGIYKHICLFCHILLLTRIQMYCLNGSKAQEARPSAAK